MPEPVREPAVRTPPVSPRRGLLSSGPRKLAVLVLVLVLAEGALRVAGFAPAGPVARGGRFTAYRFDPVTLVTLRPGIERDFRLTRANGGETVRWRTNSQGHRGPELRTDAAPRVAIYGDSNVQARFSPLASSFAAQLEQRLQAGGLTQAEVVNAGVIGFGPDQSLLRFEREVTELRPDVFILHVFADNDFGDLVRNRLFDLGPDGELRPSPHAPAPDARLSREPSWRERLGSIQLVRLLAEQLAGEPDPLPGIAAALDRQFKIFQGGRARRSSTFADAYDLDLATQPESEAGRTKHALMRGVLQRAARSAAAHGVEFWVLIQPSAVDLTTNGKLSHEKLAGYPAYDPRTLSACVAELCRELGIAHVDLYDEFVANEPSTLYFRDYNTHWNARGQALAARLMAEELLPEGR